MSWKGDSKIYTRGPDEDGHHYKRHEKAKTDRMVAKSDRLSGGGGGEIRELELRKQKWYRVSESYRSKLHGRALTTMRTAFSSFDGIDDTKVEISGKDGKEGTSGESSSYYPC